MHRQHMRRIPPVLEHPDAPADQAHVVLLGQAPRALPTPHPGEHDPHIPHGNAGRLRPPLHHPPHDLVPHRQRQHDPPVLQRHCASPRPRRSTRPRCAGRCGTPRNASPPTGPGFPPAPASASPSPRDPAHSPPPPRRACDSPVCCFAHDLITVRGRCPWKTSCPAATADHATSAASPSPSMTRHSRSPRATVAETPAPTTPAPSTTPAPTPAAPSSAAGAASAGSANPLRPDRSGVLVRQHDEVSKDTGEHRQGVIITLLTNAAFKSEGLAETVAAAIAAGVPTFLNVPGPPGHTSARARINDALADVVAFKDKPGLLDLLRRMRAKAAKGRFEPINLKPRLNPSQPGPSPTPPPGPPGPT